MTGKIKIKVNTRKVKYSLELERGITVIRGDSASGKTELVQSIARYNTFRKSSGIIIESPVELQATWRGLDDAINYIKKVENEVLFFDEDQVYTKTREFASAVEGCDAYIVIVSREDLRCLPYSVKAIKTLSTSHNGEYMTETKEMHKLNNNYTGFSPDKVVVEDSKSGFEMFSNILGCECISSYGNANIYDILQGQNDNNILVIVDGAAFGAYYYEILQYIESIKNRKIVLWTPESFEFLILKSGVFDITSYYDKLEHTYKYADTRLFFSWERYYTSLLNEVMQIQVTEGYNKKSMSRYLACMPARKKFKDSLPDWLEV